MEYVLAEALFGLFGDYSQRIADLIDRAAPLLKRGGRLGVPFLFTFALISAWLYMTRDREEAAGKGFLGYFLPRDVYLHGDAIRTYLLVAINAGLGFFVTFGTLLISVTQISALTQDALAWAFGPGPQWTIGIGAIVGCAVAVFIVQDFAMWLVHYLFHKVPILWEFHKVHHCPKVLTPITDRQFHPVEFIGKGISAAIFVGPVVGVIYYLFGTRPPEFTILGLGALTLVFFIYGNFRHSHIWLEFPRWLSFVFSSPAMHHVHHSKAEEHWDKNMAITMSLWDYLFGTLYIPRGREKIDFGVAGAAEDEFDSLTRIYLGPFVRIFRKVIPAKTDQTANAGVDGSEIFEHQ